MTTRSLLIVFACLFALTTACARAATPSARVAGVPEVTGIHDIGAVPPTMPVRLTFVLRERHGRELDALIDSQSDSQSPLFRRFLSQTQMRDYFFPTAAEYARTVALLRQSGFTLVRTSQSRLLVDVTAPAVVVERYLHTTIHRVVQPGYGVRYLNVTPAVIPAGLAIVSGVVGLDDLTTIDNRSRLTPLHRTTGAPASPAALYGPDSGFGPLAVENAFDFPLTHDAKYDGKGVSVADLVLPSTFAQGDAAYSDRVAIDPYLRYFGVKRSGPPTVFLGAGGCGSPCGPGEDPISIEDAQAVIATAPSVAYQVYMFFVSGSDIDAHILAALDDLVAWNRSDIVTITFSSCEKSVGSLSVLSDEEFAAGAAEGITFVTVADGGARACSTLPAPTVEYPADSPHVLAVAGVDFDENSRGGFAGNLAGDLASNGGASAYFSVPRYQQGIAGMLKGGRNVPDIAGPAAINGVGVSFYFPGFASTAPGWYGGSPFIDVSFVAGALAEVEQMRGGRLGLIDRTLYSAFTRYQYEKLPREPFTLFRDVLRGCNGASSTLGPYCATRGYDHVTGIGMLDAYALGILLK